MDPQFIRVFALMFAAAAGPLLGQVALQVQKAELSVPFGVASGRLVAVGEYLVFADDEQPEASFAIARDGLRDLSVTRDILTIETAKPVRDRSTKLTFRLGAPADGSKLTAWFKAAPSPVSDSPSAKAGVAALQTYQVKHDHLVGSCSGRLIVEANRIVFESITDIGHSRQWGLMDIKELKRDNPYGIKVVPFSGDTNNLEILGNGMDSDEYRTLVDRITAARIRR